MKCFLNVEPCILSTGTISSFNWSRVIHYAHLHERPPTGMANFLIIIVTSSGSLWPSPQKRWYKASYYWWRFRRKRWSNLHEFSHLKSAFRTNDRGFRKENGSSLFALLIILSRTSITALDKKFLISFYKTGGQYYMYHRYKVTIVNFWLRHSDRPLLWWLCGLRHRHWLTIAWVRTPVLTLSMWESCQWLGVGRWFSPGTPLSSTIYNYLQHELATIWHKCDEILSSSLPKKATRR